MRITRDNIAWWQKNIKRGDLISYEKYMCDRKSSFAYQFNHRNIWVSLKADPKGHTGGDWEEIIEWKEVTDIYTREKDPEMFI